VALVRTDVSEELSASFRVTRIGELGTTLAVTSNRRTVRIDVSEELSASFRVTRIGELGTTLAVTSNRRTVRTTRSNIPEDTILHSHRRENLRSYIEMLLLVLN
jgi:hypothetical protein